MGWPTPQEYNEAVQNPHIGFADKELQSGTIALNELGLPRAITGSFASVYKVKCGETTYAVRCFLHEISDQRLRYERLSKAICTDSLECTVDFEFQDEGISVSGKTFPIVKMAWLTGENLDVYVRNNLGSPDRLLKLRDDFRALVHALEEEGFAHGDLQHGNIIVTADGIRLVDYDGMYVPSLTGLKSNELGHRNFQHPARTADHFGQYLDNFSVWVIDSALSILVEDSSLFTSFSQGEGLMFRREDFVDPIGSELFFQLESHESTQIRQISRRLRTVLRCHPYNVPRLCTDVAEIEEHPRVAEAAKTKAKLMAQVQDWAVSAAAAQQEEKERKQRIEEEEAQRQLAEQRRLLEQSFWLDEETRNALAAPDPKATINFAGSQNTVTRSQGPRTGATRPVAMPFRDQYQKALADPSSFIHPALRSGVSDKPPAMYGAKNAVFAMKLSNGESAVKLFCHEIPDIEKRFALVEQELANLPSRVSSYFLKVNFLPQAVEVNKILYPALVMPWQSGQTLEEELLNGKPDFDYTLLNRFRRMMHNLAAEKICHGSLSPTNIIVKRRREYTDLVLVDYDNICTPAMLAAGLGAGTQNLCHPLSQPDDYGLFQDNFSAWLLDTLLLCWSEDRALWNKFGIKRGCHLFRAEDLEHPETSELFGILCAHQTWEISERGKFLLRCLKKAPADIPPLVTDGTTPVI